MRKVTFGGANSLDNYIARKNDEVDWLMWDKEVSSISGKFWKTIDTVVMGRKTFEVTVGLGSSGYLELIECQQLKNGCVVLRYEVKRKMSDML